MNGRGLGRTLGVWLSIDTFLRRAGEFGLSAFAIKLSCNTEFVGVESSKLPFTTLLGVESTVLSLNSDLRPDCTRLDAAPVAGVRAMEETGPDCGSAMVDADPRGSARFTGRFCPAGVDDRVAAPERPDTCRWIRCW